MKVALVHKHYDKKHLEEVKKDMLLLGAPVIHAVWMECYDHYAALEGCHRLRAAQELGITPEIIEVEYNEDMISDVLGSYDDEDYKVSDIADESYKSLVLTF